MAALLQIQRPNCTQELDENSFNKGTPPENHTRFPLTPPATTQQYTHRNDSSGVVSAMCIFKQHQKHILTNPWTSTLLDPTQYDCLLENLQQDPVLHSHVENSVRFDYDPRLQLLSVRMPGPIHEFFTASLVEEISKQLAAIRQRGDSSAAFATRIKNGGSARIFLAEDNPDLDSKRAMHRHEPDAQFQHENAKLPGVVVEISYSQDGKNLKKLARDYIEYSNGDIKVVIGIDIKYSNTKEATLSVWRPQYIYEDGEELDILEAKETITSQSFRAPDGTFVNLTHVLRLTLDDFATDKISGEVDFGDSTGVEISYKMLAQFLNKAEEMQEARELMQGRQHRSLASTRKTRKRRRSLTPSDQLRSEDETNVLDKERETEEKIDVVDSDFSSETPVITHGQLRRRSTRHKLRES